MTLSHLKKLLQKPEELQAIIPLIKKIGGRQTVHSPLLFLKIAQIKWLLLWAAILISNVPRR